MATVVLLGSLDTKGREYRFVCERLLEAGVTPVLVDFGVLSDPTVKTDISAAEVAAAAGHTLEELRLARKEKDNRAVALDVMTAGLIAILDRLRSENRCDAVFGLGGSGGTSVVSAAMQSLPLGVPKLIVSTMACGNIGGYIGTKDIAILYSRWTVSGTGPDGTPVTLGGVTSDVVRRQSDGHWLFAIDNPLGGAA